MWRNMSKTYIEPKCSIDDDDKSPFKYGIYVQALTSEFKYTWSGACNQHISRRSSVFYSSSYFGSPTLLLFSLTYLQSLTVRLEEMRVKKRDSEQWMHHRVLPPELRERVRRYDQYKWLETRGVDEESLVQNLPKDLRRDIKRHLCLNLVRRVPLFANMDDRLLDAI
ncbi:hypothetical protein OROGR_030204 [Orobanche gracilis]